jgi:hypothetical protein
MESDREIRGGREKERELSTIKQADVKLTFHIHCDNNVLV